MRSARSEELSTLRAREERYALSGWSSWGCWIQLDGISLVKELGMQMELREREVRSKNMEVREPRWWPEGNKQVSVWWEHQARPANTGFLLLPREPQGDKAEPHPKGRGVVHMSLRPGLSKETGTQSPKLWYEQRYEHGGPHPRTDLLPRPGAVGP